MMRRLRPTDAHGNAASLLKQCVGKSPDAAVMHRLHCVVLVGAGWSCAQVASAFGNDPRSVQRWVRRFEAAGAEGLRDSPAPGRPASLGTTELEQLRHALQEDPRSAGHASAVWDAATLRSDVERRFGVTHSLRHCARLLASLRGAPPAGIAADAVRENPQQARKL